MATGFKVISVEKSVVDLTPTTQDILGCDFTPKGFLVFSNATDSANDGVRCSIGFYDGTRMRSIGVGVTDAAGTGGTPTTTQAARIDRDDHAFYQMTGTGATNVAFTVDQWITHTSGTNGGVRIRFLNNNTSAWQLKFFFFGGTDLTNVKCGTFTLPAATGNFDVTDPGFPADAFFLLSTNADTAVNTLGVLSRTKINFGFACSPSRQFAEVTTTQGGTATTNSFKLQSLSSCYLSTGGTAPTVISQANFVEKIATGFRLNFTTVDNVQYPVFYLAFQGGSWDTQSVDTRTTVGTQTLPTTFQPKGVIATSIVSPNETAQNNHTFALGGASATGEQAAMWHEDVDNVAPSQVARSGTATDMLQTRITAVTGSTSAIDRQIDLSSFGATNCVVNHATVSATVVKVNYILLGDSPSGQTTVVKDYSFPYHIRILREKDYAFPYHMGGAVTAGPFEARYNIQGIVVKDYSFSYNIQTIVEKDYSFLYNINANTNEIVKDYSFPYSIIGLVQKDYEFLYHIDEAPGLNLTGYLKPYRCRIFIMSFDGTETYHTFNGFDIEASNIGVNGLEFDLARDSAGDFTLTVEDSNLMIDTSLVGEGCSILIQVAKRESELGDGGHDVLWGYMKVKDVQRPDTNNLVYVFTGFGAAIRTMERIVDFRDEARRKSHSSTEPDTTDTKMQAYKLFERLFSDRSIFPAGMQAERQFDPSGIANEEPKVDVFIPIIDQYLVEMSSAANFIADNSNAVWGITPNRQPYIKYKDTQKTSIILKGTVSPDDDKFRTAYIIGGFSFHDSIRKSDGFFNCLYAVVGTKDITTNVFNVAAIRDRFTPLALDEPPSDAADAEVVSDIGPLIPMYNADPQAAIWDELVNQAKLWPLNIFRVVVKPYSGNAGFASINDTAQANWNSTIDKLQDAVIDGILVFGWVDLTDGSKSLSQVQDEIEEYATLSQVDGIFLDNCPSDTGSTSYLNSITDYADNFNANRGQSSQPLRVYANTEGPVPQSFYTSTGVDRFIIHEDAGLPNVTNMMETWYGEVPPSRRIVWCHTVTTSAHTDAAVKDFVKQATELNDLANIIYITDEDDSPGQYSRLSTRFAAYMEQMDISAAKSLQNAGHAPPGRAVQQDLCMSFIAQSARTSDLVVILSKVGNPISEPGENLNVINGLIMGNRTVQVTEVDPETNQTIVREVNMPDFTRASQIASFNIPFNEVGVETPTVHFLHKTVTKANVRIGDRYWVFIRGRGQNASNTFRWHHADSVGFEYLSGRRLPSAGAYSSAHWDIFTNESHPGFSLSYLQNTTQLSVAMNGDSARIHGQVDELVDLSDVTDDVLVAKIQQSMLQDASQPKRVYEFDKVTVPDDLILPGQLITIVDDLSEGGQAAGGTAGGIQAEVVEVSYKFNAAEDPEGCSYVSLRAIANVNREFAYYTAKLNRGDIDIDFPFIPAPSPRPLPDTNAPVINASPKGGIFNTPVSVKFISSKSDVTIYYTTDGTTPLVLFGTREDEILAANTPHTTQIYIPGTTPDLRFTKTTELQFIATDTVLNRSTVYYEKYTILAPETAAGKSIQATFFQDTGMFASTIAGAYSLYTKNDTDHAILHKRLEETVNSTWENAVLGVPSKFQEVEFQSYDDMAAYVGGAKAKGFDIIGYNLERDDSPDTDTRNVVGSVERFSKKVRGAGLLCRLNPRHDYTKTYAARLAKYADIYNIQAHHLQGDGGDVDDFKRYVKDMVQTLRANNSKIYITITLSADTNQHASLKNQNRLETLKTRWTWAKKYVDGLRLFYKTDSQFNNFVIPFIQWFNLNGRE